MTTEVSTNSGVSEEAAVPVSDVSNDTQPDQVEERQVPLAALESERAQRQSMQDELKLIKEHLSLMQTQRQIAPQEPQEPVHHDDDVMTFGEFRKVAGQFQNQIHGTLSELQMSKKHSDYDDVVRKYLPQVIKDDPSIAKSLQSTQDFNLAYRLAKTSDAYRKDHHQVQRNADADRIISNSQQTGNLSSVGGTSPINMAKRYKDMSDKDFRKEMAKNVGYS